MSEEIKILECLRDLAQATDEPISNQMQARHLAQCGFAQGKHHGMKLQKTEEYHEDEGCCLFFSFSRDNDGNVLGEPPEVMFSSGYVEPDFDPEKWTHFITGVDLNSVFEQADPKSFPRPG